MTFSCPLSSNDINNCSALASPETSDDCDEVTDDLMEASPCRDERKLPVPNSVSPKTISKTVPDQIVLPDANTANGIYICIYTCMYILLLLLFKHQLILFLFCEKMSPYFPLMT